MCAKCFCGTCRANNYGPRAFANRPRAAAAFATGLVNAYKRAGLMSAAEHFPGLGGATQSPDDGLASAARLASDDPRIEKVCIWANDKDLAQCVRGDRVVQIIRRGMQIRNAEAVRAKDSFISRKTGTWPALGIIQRYECGIAAYISRAIDAGYSGSRSP